MKLILKNDVEKNPKRLGFDLVQLKSGGVALTAYDENGEGWEIARFFVHAHDGKCRMVLCHDLPHSHFKLNDGQIHIHNLHQE